MEQMTDKQKIFIEEYLVDLNATQAAIRAGYSEETANRIASENLSKPVIRKAIEAAMQKRLERVKIDQDYVLNRLVEIDLMDISDIFNNDWTVKPLNEWPKVWHEMLTAADIKEFSEGHGGARRKTALVKKLKWPDKLKNLELLGRHVDVKAWKDKVENENIHTVYLHDPSAGTKVEQY